VLIDKRSQMMRRIVTSVLLWFSMYGVVYSQPWSATQAAGPVDETGATLNGMVTPNGQPTTAWFEWGTNVSYGQLTRMMDSGQGFSVIRASVRITGLTAGTVYHYRLVSSNAMGVVYGGDQRWITGGKLVSWGSVQPRDWLGRLTMVAVRSVYTVAVRTDGTVLGWGEPGSSQPPSPVGISNVVAAACGWAHSLALKADGTVVSWGKVALQTRVPQGLSNVIAIACARDDSLALKVDGSLVVWGQNASTGTKVPEGLTNVVAIAGGNSMFVALKADGTVAVWGTDCYGASMVTPGLSNVVAVAGGYGHCLALQANGRVVAWGLNSLGQTDVPTGLSNVIGIACGDMHSFALKADGTITAWGLNASGEGNIPPGLHDPGAIAAGPHHCVAVRALGSSDFKPHAATQPAWNITTTHASLKGMALPNGTPSAAWFEWGPDTNYGCTTPSIDVGSRFTVVGVSATIDGLTPHTIYHYRLVASNAFDVAYGKDNLLATGLKVASWGSITNPPTAAGEAVAIAAGDRHCLALRTDGTVVAWGASFGGVVVVTVPPGLSNGVELAASDRFNLVLKSDGTVSAWGTNLFSTVPVTVPAGLSDVVAVAASATHCLVLKTNGTVASWGYSAYSLTNVPPGLDNVVAIQAGYDHSLALRSDGTVVGWGGSSYNPSRRSSPTLGFQYVRFGHRARGIGRSGRGCRRLQPL
jgi:alpha-tubulin suppressor-like RCC1 family protein